MPVQQAGRKRKEFPLPLHLQCSKYVTFSLPLVPLLPSLCVAKSQTIGKAIGEGAQRSATPILLVPRSSNMGWFGAMVLTYLPRVKVPNVLPVLFGVSVCPAPFSCF